MSKGIIIFGAPGAGDTTLGKELAIRLNFHHFDLDDYLWDWNAEIPFSVVHPREKRINTLMNDIAKSPNFVMSGSMFSIREHFTHLFDLAVFITTPTAVRLERIRAREFARFGARILEGGDMHENHKSFLDYAERYDTNSEVNNIMHHEQWINEFTCPVLRIDGEKAISDNILLIVEQLEKTPLSP